MDVRRWLHLVAAVFSIVAPAAVLLLWGASYFRVVGLSNALLSDGRVRGGSGIWSTGGRVLLDTVRPTDISRVPGLRGWTLSVEHYDPAQPQWIDQPAVTRWHAGGFKASQSFSRSGDGSVMEWAAVAIPYWAIAAAALPLPLWVLGPGMMRRRRKKSGRCERCGYDLRASPTLCPECGAIVPAGEAEEIDNHEATKTTKRAP